MQRKCIAYVMYLVRGAYYPSWLKLFSTNTCFDYCNSQNINPNERYNVNIQTCYA